MIRSLEHLSCEDRLEESRLFSLEKTGFQGDLLAPFRYLKGTYKEAGAGLFTRACSDGTRDGGFKLKNVRFRIDNRKTSLGGWSGTGPGCPGKL